MSINIFGNAVLPGRERTRSGPAGSAAAMAKRVPCEQCPLRGMDHFREFSPEELRFVANFKRGELLAEAGSTILSEGVQSPNLFTLMSGWAFRYKTLEDGRRQILNYLLPGDLVGLQGSVLGEMQHSVEALSPVVLCVFPRDQLIRLFRAQPNLGFDVTWLASREERMLDEHLLAVGRRSATEKAAYLIAFIYMRASKIGWGDKPALIPITQQHIADTLGLSIVHTNKTLKKLSDRKLIRWLGRSCEVLDIEGLTETAGWDGSIENRRPMI